MINRFEYKDATAERKAEMLSEIISHYNLADKAQVIQALAHCQASLEGVTQDEFVEVAGVSSARTMREWKREYIELYNEAFEKYSPTPEVLDVQVTINEDVMEQVYQNMLEKLSDKRTSAKDLSTLLSYLNISSTELKQYAKHRGSTLRSFIKDNEALLIKDEDVLNLTKAVIAESDFLYQGTQKTQGRTDSFLQMDLEDSLVKLELMTAGMLMYSLWNGVIHPNYIEMAETLRVLKLVSGEKLNTKQAMRDFDSMDGRPVKLKPIKLTESDCIDIFGVEDGRRMYQSLTSTKKAVDKKTVVPLPKYEDVKADYENLLKFYSDNNEKPFSALIAELEALGDKETYKDKYKQFLTNQEEM